MCHVVIHFLRKLKNDILIIPTIVLTLEITTVPSSLGARSYSLDITAMSYQQLLFPHRIQLQLLPPPNRLVDTKHTGICFQQPADNMKAH